MKIKIMIIAAVAIGFATSCASTCHNDKWRKRRFVEVQHQPTPLPAATVS